MNETIKTLVMVGVALVVSLVALVARPVAEVDAKADVANDDLFADFKDPTKAGFLKVVEYDETQARLKEFEIRRNAKQFVITSKSDYPADAKDHLRDAATSLVGLKVLSVASELPGEHELFGVVAPDKEKTKVGEKGVGNLVTIKDEGGNALASLIIGKPVEGKPELRFVRRDGQNAVLVVKFDPSKLTTKFEDWIEKNLLQFSGNDLTKLEVKDYSIDLRQTPDGQLAVRHDQRLEIKLAWDQAQSWNLLDLSEKRGVKLSPTVMLDSEELNTERLDSLKQAFEDLKIVDVYRKPAKLGADLKAGADLQGDAQTVNDLAKRGFYLIGTEDGRIEILSSKGELLISTKDAVQYVLRFGENVFDAAGDVKNPGRYLMIAAQVDTEAIPKPKLAEVPGEGADVPLPEKKDDDKKAPTDLDKKRKADERANVLKENQRRTDAYEEQLKKARLKVRDLNYRFGDWYYVISDDVYKKIHLTRADLIKERTTAKDEGFGIDSFRDLEDGPKKKEAPRAPRPPMGGFPGGFHGLPGM